MKIPQFKNFKIDFLFFTLQLRDFILNLIFPVTCLGCGREGIWLCPDCLKTIPPANNQTCLNCSQTSTGAGFCQECGQNRFLNGVVAGAIYEHTLLSKAVKTMKYFFAPDLAKSLIPLLFRAALDLPKIYWRDILVVPVPLHKRRQRWRGFNQAELLAKLIALKKGWPIDSSGLIRVRYTKTQTNLNRESRARNLAKAFSWQGEDITGQNIILIDDVATSGATLEEAARALKQAGAGRVIGLVLAK